MAIGGREWLMTADHCFDLNSTIEDGGDDVIGVANRRNTCIGRKPRESSPPSVAV
jgi:hypothetical protein